MEASKQDALDALMPALRLTRIGLDISWLEYKDGNVIVHWSDHTNVGWGKRKDKCIDVDCCSTLAMIKQVCGELL